MENFNRLLAFLGEDKRCKFMDVVHDNEHWAAEREVGLTKIFIT